MFTQQLYTGCLAQGAYYIESNGVAAVIDPLREADEYIRIAHSRGAVIRYVFESHFHADFVSGHLELAQKTGATIVYGPTTLKTGFDVHIAADGEEFDLGGCRIRLIHTPGHTMESSCYLLIDEQGTEQALFTGDTLFIGDVGRPDLAQKVIAELTQEKLAGHLFDSLRNKIMPLSDSLIIYPGHGAGSACGKKMSSETHDTLGHQKRTNYALDLKLSKEEFIQAVLTGLTPPPAYFPQNVLLNISGSENLDDVLKRALVGLSPEVFEAKQKSSHATILDTRLASAFSREHIPGSINLGIDGSFATWVGTVFPDVRQPLLFVSEPGREHEVITRLARVGYDHAVGFLEGGMEAWKNSGRMVSTVRSVDAVTLADLMNENEIVLLDVRKASEFRAEHVKGAINIPLDYYRQSLAEVEKLETAYVYCASGYRSMAFISLLMREGFTNLVNVVGGFVAIKKGQDFHLTEYVQQTSEL